VERRVIEYIDPTKQTLPWRQTGGTADLEGDQFGLTLSSGLLSFADEVIE